MPQNSILTTVLTVTAEEVQTFYYSGNAPYYFWGERGLWSIADYSAVEFFCPNQERKNAYNAYLDKERSLVKQLVRSLGRFAVDESFVENLTANTVLPASDYMSFGFVLSEESSPFLTIFESGDIYLTHNDGSETPARHYKALNPADYAALKKEITDIRIALDALPLDYQLSMGVYPEQSTPKSTAIRLQIDNIGTEQILFSRLFLVEKQENGAWRPLSEKEPMITAMEMLTVEPRSTKYYAIDLKNLENGQEPGHYRVTNTFYAGEEKITLTTRYEINADAMDISLPYKPEMTPENQNYYDQYLKAWGFYCPFKREYNEHNFAQDFNAYLLYYSSAYQEGKREEYEQFGIDIPAQIVEATITRHFPVTAEQLRVSLPEARNSMKYYDSQKSCYHFEGGYGGGGFDGVVTHAEKEGNLLKLSCDWYNVIDQYQFSHTVTIRLGEGENAFNYMENTVTRRADAQ
ncbi:MAG TPA: immunoglobulin-like domain-containing protein [Clostridia bacterium]|nr:immunoglobulin-like domain-containing protein [Clostridia bacterium]